ncbi:MAG: UDP-N-acetylmuramate dehydrogenase [Clostridiales bacterium]|nr:UDP-N-acetylmuramate dehydrogenase [Clostridiales bacterium]
MTEKQRSGLMDYARSLPCETLEAVPMAELTSFRIGGPCACLITVPGGRELTLLLARCRELELEPLLLGNGSNLLVGDEGIAAPVLRLSPGEAAVEGNRLSCPAGLSLKQLCRTARDHGLSGLEFAYGIPGTVGGAVFMNAGAYGGEIADVIISARAADQSGRIQELTAEELALSYRSSRFMTHGLTVLSADFLLTPDNPSAISGRMEEFMRRRREKQPLEYPSAGSFFKRPAGQYAGALIESCGLKGFAVGGAQVSEKHAGFVINRGGASAADVCGLARQVIARVEQEHGVRLEPEVRFIGVSL